MEEIRLKVGFRIGPERANHTNANVTRLRVGWDAGREGGCCLEGTQNLERWWVRRCSS